MNDGPWNQESNYTGERCTVTLKGGKDFDAPWIVLHGGTVEEVQRELAKLEQDSELLRLAAVLGRRFGSIHIDSAAQQQPVQAAPQQAPPVPQQQAPQQAPAQQGGYSGPPQFCSSCGQQMTYKSGTGRKGFWQGLFCSTKGHPVKWIGKDGSVQ